MGMNPSAWGLLALYLALLLALAWPLGRYVAALCAGRLPAWMRRTETALCRLGGAGSAEPMRWTHYAYALLAFNLLGVLAVYALQRLQGGLPLNPQAGAVTPDSAFNTAISFVTNTNWQGYAGESTMLPDPDAGADGAELRLGGHRHRGGVRADPRLRGALGPGHRQLLGRPDARHAVAAAAAVAAAGAGAGEPGRDPELQPYQECTRWKPRPTPSRGWAPTASRCWTPRASRCGP
jgi:hypothetical protein